MHTKLLVGNLTAATTENELREIFSRHGNVAEILLPVNRGRLRGFGFVTMVTPEGARSAIEGLNGTVLGPSLLTVSEAPVHEEHLKAQSTRPNPRRGSSVLF